MTLWLIGEAPGPSGGYVVLGGRCGKALSEMAGVDVAERFELRNVLAEHPGRAERKGSTFPLALARESAKRLRREFSPGDVAFMLGKRVCRVFGYVRRPQWLDEFDRDGVRYVLLPHPSGVSRALNDPVLRAAVGARLRKELT